MTNDVFIDILKMNYFTRCDEDPNVYKKDNKELYVSLSQDGRNWIVKEGSKQVYKNNSQKVMEYLFGTGDMLFL